MKEEARKKATLLVATLASFVTPFMSSSVNVALPAIGREFSMSAILLSWVATSNLLAAAVFLVPFGRVADIHGRKRIFLYGVIFYTGASLFSALSFSAYMLIVFRIVQGIGAAMIFGTGMALITSVFSIGERGRALGLNVAAVYVGLSLGPFVGGFLTQHYGWESVFYANVPLGLLIIVTVLLKLKGEWAESPGEKMDFFGSVVYGGALIAVMYGFSLLPSLTGMFLVLAGAIGLVMFVWWELKTETPILNINLFIGNRVFAFSNLAALINYSATFTVTFLISLFLQYLKGFGPRDAGMVLIAQPLTMAVFSPFAGKLSDRIEPRYVASIGMAFTAAGLGFFIFLSENTSILYIVEGLIIVGLGLALFSSPNTNAVMSSVEKKYYGVASGTIGTMRVVGQTLSMGITMLVISAYMGRVEIAVENYPLFLLSVKISFFIFSMLCFSGILASLSRGRVRS